MKYVYDMILRPLNPNENFASFALIPQLELLIDLRNLSEEQRVNKGITAYISESVLAELKELDEHLKQIPSESSIMRMIGVDNAKFQASKYDVNTSIAVEYNKRNNVSRFRSLYKSFFYLSIIGENVAGFITNLASVQYAQSGFITDPRINLGVGIAQVSLGQIGMLCLTMFGPGAQSLDDLVEGIENFTSTVSKKLTNCCKAEMVAKASSCPLVYLNDYFPASFYVSSADTVEEQNQIELQKSFLRAINNFLHECWVKFKALFHLLFVKCRQFDKFIWILIQLNAAYSDVTNDIVQVKGFKLILNEYQDTFLPANIILIANWIEFGLNQHNDPILYILMAVLGCKLIDQYCKPQVSLENKQFKLRQVVKSDEHMLTYDSSSSNVMTHPSRKVLQVTIPISNADLTTRLLSPKSAENFHRFQNTGRVIKDKKQEYAKSYFDSAPRQRLLSPSQTS